MWYEMFDNSFFPKISKIVKATPKKKHIHAKISQFLCKQWQKDFKNRSLVGIALKNDDGSIRE